MVGYITTRNRGKNEVLYPIFKECSKLTTDEYWTTFFEDLSCGKFQRFIYILNNTLYCNNKKNSFTYNFLNKSSKIVFDELHELIINNTNIHSNRDTRKKLNDMQLLKKEIQEIKNVVKFSMIKKKNSRDILIINFVIKMKYTHDLSWEESQHLHQLIKIGFLDKSISSADVIYKDGEIKEISGIEYQEGTFVNTNESKLKKDDLVKEDYYMKHIWNKWCKRKR